MSAGRRADLIIVLAALLLGAPLLFGRALAGHDVRTYLAYAAAFAGNFRSGIVLPAWAPELNAGYGGPGLLLYPPLAHALDALALLVGIRAGIAVGAVALAGLAISGLACLAWLRAEGAGEAALAGALAYVAAPYRMVDLYERSALSEHWAFVFPPLFLLAMRAPRPRRFALGALALAGLALTNLPMLVLLGGALALAAAVRGLASFGDLLVSGALGAGIAAFALVPAALSGRWTATELFYGGGAGSFRPSQNTLFSAHALLPPFHLRVSLALLLTAALCALAFVLSRRDREAKSWVALASLALVATLPVAGAFWDAAPLFSKLQFPWRLAAPMTLALAALAGRVKSARGAGVVALLVIAAGAPLVGRATVPRGVLRAGALSPVPAAAVFPDPAEVRAAEGDAADAWLANPLLADVWYLPRTLGPALAAEIFRGGPPAIPALARTAAFPAASLRVVRWSRAAREIEVTSAGGGGIVLHALAFPGMRVALDGAPAAAALEPRTGLLALRLPPGTHRVAWRWEPFGPLHAARLVSAAALLLALALLAVPRPAAPTP